MPHTKEHKVNKKVDIGGMMANQELTNQPFKMPQPIPFEFPVTQQQAEPESFLDKLKKAFALPQPGGTFPVGPRVEPESLGERLAKAFALPKVTPAPVSPTPPLPTPTIAPTPAQAPTQLEPRTAADFVAPISPVRVAQEQPAPDPLNLIEKAGLRAGEFAAGAGEFFSQPANIDLLASLAMGITGGFPESGQFQLAQQVSEIQQSKMQANYLGRLMAGEIPQDITGPDVDTLAPELRNQAINQFIAGREMTRREAATETPTQKLMRQVTVKQAQATAVGENKELTAAYGIIKEIVSTIPGELLDDEGNISEAGLAAIAGGQELRVPALEEAGRGALLTLREQGLSTFGLENIAGFQDISVLEGASADREKAEADAYMALPVGSAFIRGGEVYIKTPLGLERF